MIRNCGKFLLYFLFSFFVINNGYSQVILSSSTTYDSLYNSLKSVKSDSFQLNAAQTPSLKWYDMFTRIPDDWVRFSKSNFNVESIPTILGITLFTTALVFTDEETWRLSREWKGSSHFMKETSEFFSSLGDGRSQFILAGLFASYGFLGNDTRALRTASQTVEAILSSGFVVQVLKHITGRQSPYVSSKRGGRWVLFPNQIEYHKKVPYYDAFPSGHIATSLATVTVIAENYSEIKWIKPVGYLICGLIGIGMVNDGIHWYSDYPLGLAIGYSFGMLASHPEGLKIINKGKGDSINLSLVSKPSNNEIGLLLSVPF